MYISVRVSRHKMQQNFLPQFYHNYTGKSREKEGEVNANWEANKLVKPLKYTGVSLIIAIAVTKNENMFIYLVVRRSRVRFPSLAFSI